MWNPQFSIVHHWDHLFGFHMNVTRSVMTEEMEVARIHPTSPDNVWSGDPGVPQTIPTYSTEEVDGMPVTTKTGSIPNPEWTEDSPGYRTVFLLFVDEDEAKTLAPHLWIEDTNG